VLRRLERWNRGKLLFGFLLPITRLAFLYRTCAREGSIVGGGLCSIGIGGISSLSRGGGVPHNLSRQWPLYASICLRPAVLTTPD